MICEHDARFKSVFNCKNGCLACQFEEHAELLRKTMEHVASTIPFGMPEPLRSNAEFLVREYDRMRH